MANYFRKSSPQNYADQNSSHQLAGNDRELLSATETLKLFTFTKSSPDSELEQLHDAERLRCRNYRSTSQETPASVDAEPEISNTTPTVDELLKMLARKGAIKGETNLTRPPPPIPPKPRQISQQDISNRSSSPLVIATRSVYRDRTSGRDVADVASYNRDLHIAKPIVIEVPDESNNNIVELRQPKGNTSTVQILEVPIPRHRQQVNSRSNSTPFTSSSYKHSIASKLELFHENNSYPAPFVSTSTDDEGLDDDDDDSNPSKQQTIPINESPLRTSTPNISQETNINISENEHSSNEEDIANISRDTDENAVINHLNQSGGCELIGVNADSDNANNSKDSRLDDERVNYQGRFFNDTTMASTINQSGRLLQIDPSTPPNGVPEFGGKVKELELTTESLLNVVGKLQSQVNKLTSRVEELEDELSEAKSERKSLTRGENAASQPSLASPKQPEKTEKFSTSTINIERLSASKQNQRLGCFNPNSTYSRSQVAKISVNSQDLTSPAANSAQINKSSSMAFPKPLRKNIAHASTSSLYSEGGRSFNVTLSPTNYMQTSVIQPNSQPTPYASMLSLSSATLSNSTLKKGSIAGSVSNLSQAPSQLSSWSTMNNYLQSKHRGKEISYDEEERVVKLQLYNSLITMKVPGDIDYHYSLDKTVEAPLVRLKLDWVYGYRGRDCRSNIFHLPTGECIYFVAAVVILYDTKEKTQRHYLGHTDSVKCLAVHPNKLIVASSQSSVINRRDKRPIVRVWNTISLATLRVISFNEDFDYSICCLAFSKHDQGATLAVVDESSEHTITILDWQRDRNWRLAEVNSGHETVLAIDFHPIDKHCLVAVGKSGVNFWDTRGLTMNKKAGLFDKYDKPKYVLCLTFNDLGDTITGDSNGNLSVWPQSSTRPKKVIRDVHHGGIFSVLAMKDGSYLTGGRDRRIIEWDEEFNMTGREAELPEHCGGVRFIAHAKGYEVLVGTLRNCILQGSLAKNFTLIVQGHAEAISSLAIYPNSTQYLTGGFDDQIHMFESHNHRVVWSKCLMMPATAACFSPNGLLLVIGSTLGKWLVLEATTQEILFTKCDGSGTISCIKFSPDGESFALGSSDSQIHVYQSSEAGNRFCRVGTCVGHSTPIKEMDWSVDSRYIQSQSMSFELLHWRATSCRPLDDMDIVAEIHWSTYNCTIGFHAIGLWSDSIDSAMVNHCDRSNAEDLMVSVSDLGNINVFKWPPSYNRCLSQKYYGNADKLNFVKFLADDSRLIAIGAKSCATIEWVVDRDI